MEQFGPGPHYFTQSGEVEQNAVEGGVEYRISGVFRVPSVGGGSEVADRAPRVNIVSVITGVWNTAHTILHHADRDGMQPLVYGDMKLRVGRRLLMVDRDYTLRATGTYTGKRGNFAATVYDIDGKELFTAECQFVLRDKQWVEDTIQALRAME